jgi:uncharacterized membrane protein YbaN (DUF454 family)
MWSMSTTKPQKPATAPHSVNRIRKWCLIAAGLLCTALAILGIFLPLLPTVPLLLLAAACFARSSEPFYRWLLEHRHLGPLLQPWLDGAGIPRRARARAIAIVWITIPASALLLVTHPWLRLLMFAVALFVTLYLLRLPTREEAAIQQTSDRNSG